MNADLYEVLEVSRGASPKDVKRSYRRLAMKYHPDKNPGDAAAEERFKAATHAFEVLSDPERRKLYDEFGEVSTRQGFDPEKARAYQQWQDYSAHGGGFNGFDFGGGAAGPGTPFGDLGDILGNMFGGGRPAGPMRGPDAESHLRIGFSEAVLGGERSITLQRAPGELKTLNVKIPAGIDNGQTIRLAGQGVPGPGGGRPGDLLIRIEVAPHPRFRREGRDLHLALPVSVGEAMRGARVDVPTPYGDVKLTIPPGSQNGARLRLKGKGVKGGALFVQLDVRLPPDADDDIIDHLERAYRGDLRADLRF